MLKRVFAVVLILAASAWVLPWMQEARRFADLLAEPAPARLPSPLPGARLYDSWGNARDGGRRRHEGIDIFAARGTPVLATTRGRITRVGMNSLGGKVVWVLGPGRQMHYYAHLDDWAGRAAGEWVWPGEVIGRVGNTGNAAGGPTHLHYGIYAAGGAINPWPLLRAGREAATAPAGVRD
ncbi:M23 family metallopeptidase [Derxia gummosa]|uniref:M23 family metallopeptidase n=1 Tax=Derxia gummosa DSM 723 TaxID=1121388 RepID=A0A8B6X7J9_9BURK|nr:M23 family metallopeptidase [Derxia gummosa]